MVRRGIQPSSEEMVANYSERKQKLTSFELSYLFIEKNFVLQLARLSGTVRLCLGQVYILDR